MTPRRLSRASRHELRDLLQGLLVTELLAPGSLLWLSGPRLQDAPILDNHGGSFSAINPGWGHRSVRLSEVLSELLQQGLQQLRITALAGDADSRRFYHRLFALARQGGVLDRLRFHSVPALPAAGVLCDTAYLSGHIAFVESGPLLKSEEASWHVLPEEIQAGRTVLEARYGA